MGDTSKKKKKTKAKLRLKKTVLRKLTADHLENADGGTQLQNPTDQTRYPGKLSGVCAGI